MHPSAHFMPNVGIWPDFKKQTIINAPFIEPGYLTAAFILQIRKKIQIFFHLVLILRNTRERGSSSCQRAKTGVSVPGSESHSALELYMLASVS